MGLSAIILAGGYATRLRPLSEYIPKPLFPLGGVPILNYIVYRLEEDLKPSRIVISTNKRFEMHFRYWIRTIQDPLIRSKIEIIPEPTSRNEEKFGAIRGIYYAIKEAWVEEDTVIIAGDNFFNGFDLRKVKRLMKETGKIAIGLYDVKEKSKAKRFGVAKIDKNYRIIDFKEKPENPESTLVSTGIYAIPKNYLKYFEEYVMTEENLDAVGKFIEWLVRKDEVYGYPYEGLWFDIGTMDSYIEANEYVKKIGLYWRWI